MSNKKNKDSLKIDTETPVTPFQDGGGVFSYLFGSDKGETTTDLLFDAFDETRLEPVVFLLTNALDKKYGLNYNKKSSSDKTILHYLIIYSNFFCSIKQLLYRFFKETNIKDSVNEYDGNGNTSGHYALYFEMVDVLDLLVSYGLDLSLKNCNGHSIDIIDGVDDSVDAVSVVSIAKSKPSAIFQRILDQESQRDDQHSSSSSNIESCRSKSGKSVANIVTRYVPEHSADTLGFVYDSEVDGMIESAVSKKSDSAINVLLSTLNREPVKSDKIVVITGGKKKGTRKLSRVPDLSVDSDSSSSNSLFRMANEFENKASKAHENAVNRIKEILKVNDIEAKAYKAILYETIKKEQPELSNYDRAMELEKRASNEDNLNSVNKTQLKEMIKIIEKRTAEREIKLSSNSSNSSALTETSEASEASKSSKYKLSASPKDTDKKKKKKDKDLTSISSLSSLSSMSTKKGGRVIKIDSALLQLSTDSGNSFFLQ
jgi:hypothetical protein